MLNQITIMGRLTKDPEIRTTTTGVMCANFTLAVDRDFKNADGDRETDFIDVVAWRNTAEFITRYFYKGRMAVASGRLQVRYYKDSNGNNRRVAEVVADNIYFADSKPEAERATTERATGPKDNDDFIELSADDLPF